MDSFIRTSVVCPTKYPVESSGSVLLHSLHNRSSEIMGFLHRRDAIFARNMDAIIGDPILSKRATVSAYSVAHNAYLDSPESCRDDAGDIYRYP